MGEQALELVYRCLQCGHVIPRGHNLPERCPECNAPREEFVLVEED